MTDGLSIFQMISGVGKSFSDSYEGGRKQALANDLGAKLRSGDYAGAADVALQGGDVKTGIELAKLGETRGASAQLATTLGGLFGPGGAVPDGPAPGSFGAMTQGSRSGSGLPTFADPSAPSGDFTANLFKRESNGNALAQSPTSSARGLGQFTRGTWNGVAKQHPELSLTPVANGQDGRIDPDQMLRATRAHTADNEVILGRAGLPVTDATRYSLHFLGPAGGPRFVAGALQNPDALATTLVRPEQVQANRNVFFNRDGSPKTAGTVMDDFARSFGGGEVARAPRRAPSPVAYASNEAEAQALERRMGMLPPDAQAATAEADLPVPGAIPLGFQIPEGASDQGAPTLPGSRVASLPGRALGQPATSNSTAGGFPDPGPAGAPAPSTALPRIAATSQLARAGVPIREAATVARTATGSPERISALVRASLIPGLSEGQSGLVKTLLANELEGSKLTNDQKEYAAGLSEGFQGTLQDWKASQRPDRVKFFERNGEQYAIDPSNPSAEPHRINLPPNRRRIWGEQGEDGQIIATPPGIKPGTAGYYEADGTPQLLTGKGTSITTHVGAGETEEAKKLGGLRGERAAAIEAAAMKAPDQIGKLNLLSRVLEGARTGTFGPAESTVVGLAQSLGIPNETIAGLGLMPEQTVNAQIATKLINESVVGMIGAGGFPANNFSNADREFLTDIFPKMSNRPEANRMAIDVLRRVQQRNLEVGDAWAEYQQAQIEAGRPVSVAEFEFNHRKSLRGKPDLFADLRQQAGGTGAPGGEGGTGTPPPKFNASKTKIDMPDAQALKGAPDTAENRQTFDARYGEGAAQFVLKRPAPPAAAEPDAAAGSKTIARGSSRLPLPPGVSTSQVVFEARKAIREGRQRSWVEDKLRAHGINPAELGD